MPRNPWSDEETNEGRKLLARGASEQEFLDILGRTKAAAVSRVRYLDDPTYSAAIKSRAKKCKAADGSHASLLVTERARDVPERVIADAARRLSASRSITAFIFGDPAPGQSALDRRQAEASV